MSSETEAPVAEAQVTNFIRNIIDDDLARGANLPRFWCGHPAPYAEQLEKGEPDAARIRTRFPPEPNGYLHIGHAKSICLNFGLARDYGGACHMRFDDTNPVKEDEEYVNAIEEDIRWLGFEWDEKLFASDYFDRMFECAVGLIKKGLAYVCDLSAEQIRETRGTLTSPGRNSPFRNRSVEENLDLFMRMKAGEFADGEKVLRAKIDMASSNLNMRDPVIYRVVHARHHNTGDKWCVYPMYDFAHPIEDALEGITHSVCTLEFEDHRPLYDWVVENCGFEKRPRQIEFARLNITNTIMSKRFLKRLVDEKIVDGWDDPRMPTLCGMRRRGYPPEAIRDFCERIGVAKSNSEVESGYLDACVRDFLNKNADRVMAVFNPVKVVLTNFGKRTEFAEVENNPNAETITTRKVSFSNELYIDGSDFESNPPPKYHRLKPDGYVRLKGAYIIHCDRVEYNSDGTVKTVFASVVDNSRSGSDESGMKVKGVIQWVNAADCVPVKAYRFKSLLNPPENGETDFTERLNRDSRTEINGFGESLLKDAKRPDRFQFMRIGYFAADGKEGETAVFNEIVGLKDSFNAKS